MPFTPGGIVCLGFRVGSGTTEIVSLSVDFSIDSMPPANERYYWALEFFLDDSSGGNGQLGYFGFQNNGNVINQVDVGGVANFALWNAVSGTAGPTAQAGPFDGEGVGFRTPARFDFLPGHQYTFTLTKNTNSVTLSILDKSNGINLLIGSIDCLPNRHLANYFIAFSEIYTDIPSASTMSYVGATWSGFRINGVETSITNFDSKSSHDQRVIDNNVPWIYGINKSELKISSGTKTSESDIYSELDDNIFNGNVGRSIFSGRGDDAIYGGSGDDVINGGPGADTIDGGGGNDTSSYSDKAAPVVVTLNGPAVVSVHVNGIAEDKIRNIENFIGGSGDDKLGGDSLANVIAGLAGKDILTGGAGNDILDGGAGNDIAVYSVARSGASVRFDTAARKLVVNAGADGTDTLVNVEQVRFSDGLYSFQYGDGASFNDFNALNGWNSQSRLPRLLVDVNGDGRTDLLGFANFGTVVSLARADGTFEPSKLAIADYGAGVQGWLNNDTFPRILADLNGDGRADILGFANFGAIVSLANADGTYQNSQLAIGDFGARFGWNSQARFRRELADVNGDHKLDLIGFGNSAVIVALGNGDGTFQPTKNGIADFGFAQGWGSPDVTPRALADVNGDGRADVVGFASTGTMVALARADGTFETTKVGIADFGSNAGWSSQVNNPRLLGDVNGDGRADIVAFAGAGVVVALAKADGTFQGGQLALSAFGSNQGWGSQDATPRQLIDLNNDDILDIIGFGPAGTSIAYGNGDGTFTDPSLDLVNFGLAQGWVSNNTFHRQIGDINGDGYPDILAFGNSATFTAINHGEYVM